MSLRFSILISLCSFTIAACSGNGWNIPPGTQCAPNFGQTKVATVQNDKTVTKVTLPVDTSAVGPTAQTSSDLKLGTYNFATADVVYNETKSATVPAPLEIAYHDDLTIEAAKGAALVGCVANPKFVMKTQDLIVTFPSAITVNDETSAITVTPRTMTLQLRPTRIIPQTADIGADYPITDLSQILGNGTKADSYVLIATPGLPGDFQYIGNYSCPSDEVPACSYTVTVHMTYALPLTPEQKVAAQKAKAAKADADKTAVEAKAAAAKAAAAAAAAARPTPKK